VNRDLHQHDLTPAAATAFAASVAIKPDQAVLEVGAGRGNLAAALLKAGAQVTAIEIDPERAAHLRERFGDKETFTVAEGDALHLAPEMPADWRIIANPPFNLTAPLFKRWLTTDFPGGPPSAIDLVLQQQTAAKLTPQPGSYTHSSVLAALFGAARITRKLKRDDVFPSSHVPLSSWSLKRNADAPTPTELKRIDQLLKSGFSGVHRMRDGLRGTLTTPQMKRQGSENGWRLEDHPRTVEPAAWRAIAEFLTR
jgi:16S rRNA (adenine1518-N6/adenine1519-N6)-dimethyltransferase